MQEKARQYVGIKPFWHTIQTTLPLSLQDQIHIQIGPEQVEYNLDLYNEVISYAEILLNMVNELTGIINTDASIFLRDKNSTLFEGVAAETSKQIQQKFERFISSEPVQKIKHADLVNREYEQTTTVQFNCNDILSLKAALNLERKSLEDKRDRIFNVINNHQRVKQVADRIINDINGKPEEQQLTASQIDSSSDLCKSFRIRPITTGMDTSQLAKTQQKVKIMRPLSQIPKKKVDILDDLQ
ncbi:hypothetical protein SS50377_28122 [Spironucleus salmonicida]|uniref:Uncharacterized protein n=1 Tax=Spironucleus salmonicida TaxID=348837 RepID=V6LGJ3_9EUKA|nr:hypothetical protein SS50377_28122 [Spironucleus salmonicida]|eukprot:EST42806.1 Hypothetical protein SS50377_17575 [Spironucleus salmonicida]